MSQSSNVRWRSPHAEAMSKKRHGRLSIARNKRLAEMADSIVAALGRSQNNGVVFAEDYVTLLLILALEIEHGPGARSSAQLEKERQAFYDGEQDSRTGRRKHGQGDNQQLMRDAVTLAIQRKSICEHQDPHSSMVALYLPSSPPKWTVIFADAGKIVNYIPTKRELAAYIIVEDSELDGLSDPNSVSRIPTGRERALLKKWGEQFPID